MDYQVVLWNSLHVLVSVLNCNFNIPFLELNCSNFVILIIVLCLDFQPCTT